MDHKPGPPVGSTSWALALFAAAAAISGMSCGQSAGGGNAGTGGAGTAGAGSGGASTGTGGHASGGNPGSGGGTASTGGMGPGGGTGGSTGTGGSGGRGTGGSTGTGGSGGRGTGGNAGTGGSGSGGSADAAGGAPTIAGCQILPSNHLFNTPIDSSSLPVDPQSAAYLSTIGSHNLHLDLGQSTDISAPDTYYGIPYNVVHGASLSWVAVSYRSADSSLSWDPTTESDCVDASSGAAHTLVSPCIASAAAHPVFPIPAAPLVEGGIDTDPSQPYGDHHALLLDADACRLLELYHVYPHAGGGWDIFGSAVFDLRSNALRPDGWTSTDAAGFPILPLLLRADEASTGHVNHALRFTITSSKIRNAYVWPARHLTDNGTSSTNLPPMGQPFRLKASYQIPSTFNVQARAILQAMKTYGMYIADGGSDMYVQGEPSAGWLDDTFTQVQSVNATEFEAVDLTPLHQRAGFDPNSAAVPPP